MMRADARGNRERLLDAADDLMARKGVAVSVSEIVDAAGVGAPTLYRHFGTKEGLVRAIASRRHEQVAAQMARALGQSSGWQGLEVAINEYLKMARENRAIREQRGVAVPPELHRILIAGWETLIERAQREGSVRSDVAATDVPFLISGIANSARLARYDPALQARYVALFLEGLRPPARVPLPGAAPTADQIQECFASDEGPMPAAPKRRSASPKPQSVEV
jgi:AcrR family transcriptional regulator